MKMQQSSHSEMMSATLVLSTQPVRTVKSNHFHLSPMRNERRADKYRHTLKQWI
jgi:hypothetical protein